jgi:hypothetical protein
VQLLVHCSTRESDPEAHGRFTYLVVAPDPDAARARLRERLERARAESDLLDGPVEVYLDDLIEVGEIPDDGLIGRYTAFLRDPGTSLSMTLPGSDADSCMLHEPAEDEDEDESEEGVTIEPFAVFGAKGG